MNKLQIIAKNAHTFFIDRLREEARELSLTLEIINPWESQDPPVRNGKILVRSTAIHGSDHDLAWIKKYDLKTLPPLRALETLRTKPLQFGYFSSRGIPHLPWLDLLSSSAEEISSFCAEAGPWLIKPQRGQGGWGIKVFTDVRELLSWWEESTDREYLLQPYQGDFHEERLFFMGETYLALRRIKKGIAANFRQEGEALEVEVSGELKRIVDLIKEDLGLIYGAADFLISPAGRAYLLEMNLVPGIEQLEQVSGRNIAAQLLAIFSNP